jgi:hypothetical protein
MGENMLTRDKKLQVDETFEVTEAMLQGKSIKCDKIE